MNEDLLREMEEFEVKESPSKVAISANGRVYNQLKFEHYETDSELTTIIKEEINKESLNYSDVYSIHGKTLGMNMITAMCNNTNVTWERFKKWAEVLNKDIEIILKDKEE